MTAASPATGAPGGRTRNECPVCSSSDLKYEFVVDGHPVHGCERCSLQFLNPDPPRGAEPGARAAAAVDETDAGDVHAANAAAAIERLSRYAGLPGGRLLLVGATPQIDAEARRRGWEVVVRSACSLEQDLTGETVGAVQACLLHRVLESVSDPRAVLGTIRRMLVPGGSLMVVSATLDSPAARLFGSWWWEFREENRFYFTADTLQNLLLRAGYGDPIILRDRAVVSLRYLRERLSAMPPMLRYRLLRFGVALAPGFLRERAFRLLDSRTAVLVRVKPARLPARLSVVMPVYNERSTFPIVMERLLAKRLDGVEIEVLVVESNSQDGTRELVRRYEPHPRVRVMLEDRPHGKGHAVRRGFEAATGDVVLIQDADLEYDIDDYDSLVTPILRYEQSFVIGSRHIRKGRVWKMRQFNDVSGLAFLFNFGHLVFLALFNLIYRQKLKDPFSMYKVFRRDCLYGLRFECNRFDFDFELTIKLLRKGYRPVELPVNYKARSFTEGKKVTIVRDPLTWLRALVKFRFSALYGEEYSVVGRVPSRSRLFALAGAVACVVAFYFWTATTSGLPCVPARDLPYYNAYLAKAFAAGQTHLLITPHRRLLRLADPYDPDQNGPYRLHDAVLFDGKYYLYYGPAPALLLFAPFRTISGLDLPEPLAVALLCSIGLVFAFLLLRQLAPPETPFALLLAAIPALGFGSVAPFLLRRPLHYEVAIAAGYAFAFASLNSYVAGALGERVRPGWLAAGSVLLGCAGASRFPMLAAGLVPLVLVTHLVASKPKAWRDRLRLLVAAFAPVLLCVFLLGLYNELRFGSWTEFGMRYTLQGWKSARTYEFFNWARAPLGFFYYVLVPPHVTTRFPFFHLDPEFVREPPADYYLESMAGLLPSAPLLAILLFAPLFRRAAPAGGRGRHLVTASCLVVGLVLLTLYCVSAGTMRYEVDFATFFVIPALVLWFSLLMRATGWRLRLAALAFALLLLVTVVLQAAYSLVGYYDLPT